MNDTSEKIAKCRIDTLDLHRGPLVAMRMLHDGRLLSWDKAGTLAIWDGNVSALMAEKHFWKVQGAVQVGETRVASWSSSELILWDIASRTPVSRSCNKQQPMEGIARLGDQHFVTWDQEGTLRMWSSIDGKLITRKSRHGAEFTTLLSFCDGSATEDTVSGVFACAGGQRVLTWSHADLKVWDIGTGDVRTIKAGVDAGLGFDSARGHGFWIRGARVTDKGRWILTWSGSPEESVKLWDAQTLELATCFYLDGEDRGYDIIEHPRHSSLSAEQCEWPDGSESRDEQEIPATTVLVRGKQYIYVFALPTETADDMEYELQIRHKPQDFLVGHRGVIRNMGFLQSGRIVSNTVTEAAIWEPSGEDFIPLVFQSSPSEEIRWITPLDGERCATAHRHLITIWDFSSLTVKKGDQAFIRRPGGAIFDLAREKA